MQADMELRGVLCWAGWNWGDPEHLLDAARGAAVRIKKLEAELKKAKGETNVLD